MTTTPPLSPPKTGGGLIILDLGNVLLDINFSRFTERAAAVSRKPAAEIHERYIKGEAKKRFERGELTENDFFTEMSGWLGWPKVKREELVTAWCAIFSETEGAQDALRSLKDYRIWILSDTDPAHVRWFSQKFPWTQKVERKLYSFEREKRKADPGAFESVIEEAKLPAEQIVFFDDLAEHVARAKKLGINAHVFTDWMHGITHIR